LVGKPTLLVPSPHVAEDHQTKNAKSVVNRQGAILVPDTRIAQDLEQEVRTLLLNESAAKALGAALLATSRPEAAKRVADEVLLLVDTKR
jgi:UDP-N-acetylglucosamine--N-acetylmuramyl-(pentapeptide) pyrophosphoryl-undecaprenol N-acetylglucosamine transferase